MVAIQVNTIIKKKFLISVNKYNVGHQFRAFNGIKFEESNDPSLQTCEDIKDNELYIDGKGVKMKWSEFKVKNT